MGENRTSARLWPFSLVALGILVGFVFALVALNNTTHATDAPAMSSGYLMISSADFAAYRGDNVSLGPGQSGGYLAPLHLPQGARITQITAHFSVTVPLSFATFISIEQQSKANFTPMGVIVIPASVQSGMDVASSNLISTVLIDNSQYGYRVRVSTDGTTNNPPPPCPPGSTCGDRTNTDSPDRYSLYQIRIDYTFDSYLPGVLR